MIRILCVVERIAYQNPDNDGSVSDAAVKGYHGRVTVIGNRPGCNVGSVLLLDGD